MKSRNCIEKEASKENQAALLFAKRLGLIEDASFMALEQRRIARNTENIGKIMRGEPVYGLISYSAPAYLQYELTRFKLDFTEETDEIKKNYEYHIISEEEKKEFYLNNQDIFTRYHGDEFSYKEVELIIEKRIREAEYEKNIKDILCQLP